MRITLVLISLFSFFIGLAQSDALLLKAEQLDTEDIREESATIFNQKIISASRSLQELSDFPFTIYVITKQEIEEKGYNTLVDALKWIPGIRVSQPGSGFEGETFTMRGLHGNTYAKILINGMPIRPYPTRGMPIGAQLPIREAERIEVIFGPVAALYGSDAAAGVINIITRQSERPLYTQANISIGANGYSSIHALFGGKLGRGNKIFKYNIYGSTTSFDTRNIFQDTAYLYNPDNYDIDQHYLESPNYRSNGVGSILPSLNETPHLSRLGGVDFSFQNFSLSAQRMYRRDHSAIGLNPAAISYNNPNNFIAETIDNVQLSWDKEWAKVGLRINGHGLRYKSDKNSSFRYVHNILNRGLNLGAEHTSSTPEELEMKEQAIFDRYFSGSRFIYNESREYRLEFLNNYTPFRFVELVIGGDFHHTNSTIENFLQRPYDKQQLGKNDVTIDE